MKQRFVLKINGEDVETYVEPWRTLQETLHDELDLTGTKSGCETGHCGSCTVMADGKAVRSCLMLVAQATGQDIRTIEGLATGEALHPLQQAFIDHFAVQCGFCTPGMLMTARALLDENPSPTEEEVREAVSGNLCRCTGYVKPVEAVLAAAEELRRKR